MRNTALNQPNEVVRRGDKGVIYAFAIFLVLWNFRNNLLGRELHLGICHNVQTSLEPSFGIQVLEALYLSWLVPNT